MEQTRKIGLKVKCTYYHKRSVGNIVVKGEKLEYCTSHRPKDMKKRNK
jgi:hypothetical protein